jgi:hypothetical protein
MQTEYSAHGSRGFSFVVGPGTLDTGAQSSGCLQVESYSLALRSATCKLNASCTAVQLLTG